MVLSDHWVNSISAHLNIFSTSLFHHYFLFIMKLIPQAEEEKNVVMAVFTTH